MTLDVTDRLPRFIGSYTYMAVPARGTRLVSVPGMIADGTWFFTVAGIWDASLTAAITTGGVSLFNHNYYGSSPANALLIFRA